MRFKSIAGYITVLILLAALVGGLAALPAGEASAFSGGDGTAGNPWIITNVSELQEMNLNLSAYYKLGNNIDASATSGWNSGAGFIPVGNNSSASFLGSFDGDGYTITGLYINRPTMNHSGLFGHVGNSTATTVIKNVNLNGTTVYGGATGTGTLIGTVVGNGNTSFINCSSDNGVVSGGHAVGGLIGDHNSWRETPGGTDNPVVKYSWANVSVSFANNGDGLKFGGLVGCSQKGTISNCYARGNVTHSGYGERIGGLAGCIDFRGELIDSYSTGLVTVAANCTRYGGLVGNRAGQGNNQGVVTNCFWDVNTSGQTGSAGGTGLNTSLMKTQSTFTDATWNFITIWNINASYNNGYPRLIWTGVTPIPVLTINGSFIANDKVYDGNNSATFANNSLSLNGSFTGGGNVYLNNTVIVFNNSSVGTYIPVYITSAVLNGSDAGNYSLSLMGAPTTMANISYTLNISSTAGGDVTTPGEGPYYYYNHSEVVTITATNDSCYNFVNWTGDTGTIANASAASTTINMRGNYSVTANFALDTFSGGDGSAGNPYLIDNVCQLQNMRSNLGAHYALNNSIDASNTSTWDGGVGFMPVGSDSTPFTGSLNGSGHTITGLFINRSATDYVGLFGYINGGSVSDLSLIDVDIAGYDLVGGIAGQNTGTVNNSYAIGNISGNSYVGGLIGNNLAVLSNSYAMGDVNGSTKVGGLVGRHADGQISNCYSTGNVSGDSQIGGLAGYNDNGNISDSYATGYVNGTGDYIGGFIGVNIDGASVSNSSASGNVSGYNYAGGLVGENQGSVSNSYAMGNTSGNNCVGGLVGQNFTDGAVNNSYSTGNVSGKEFVGGLVGYSYYSSISNSYSTGNVHGDTDYVGGLVGIKDSSSVTNSYSIGSVSGGNPKGGLVGENNGGSLIGSFYDTNTSGMSDTGKGEPKTTAQMKNLSTFTGASWDIEENSEHNMNDGYPYLSWQVPGNSPVWYIYSASVTLNTSSTAGGDVTTPGEAGPYVYNSSQVVDIVATPDICYHFVNWTGDVTTVADVNASSTTITMNGNYSITANFAAGAAFGGGSGTAGDPWLITNVDELQAMTCNLSAHYALAGDINASGTSTWNSGAGFMPVGNGSGVFTGSLEGNGYTITGLFINRSATDYAGLFGYINTGGAVSNVSLANVNITGASYVGGLIGITVGSTVSNSSAAGNVSGTSFVGGLMGFNDQGGTVSNSSAAVNVSGTWNNVGGLAGYNNDSTVSNSSATGNVSGTSSVGGLIGSNEAGCAVSDSSAAGNVNGADNTGGLVGYNDGTVSNSNASGNVSGTSSVGGLAGYNNDGTVSNSSATGNVSGNDDLGGLVGANYGTVANSSAAGNVSGTGSKIGGLAGYNYEADISNSGASGDVIGPAGSYSYCGGLVGYDIRGNISNSSAAGNVSGGITAGGLMAYSTGGNVSGSSATGNLSGGGFAGGLIGYIEYGTVINCSALGGVNSSSGEVGGLIGESRHGTVLNCSATGNVSGSDYAGGLVGYNQNTSVSGSFAIGNVSITGGCAGGLIGYSHTGSAVSGSYATGNVNGRDSLGGLIGQNLDSTVSDSYAAGAVNGSQAGVGGLIGDNYNGTVFNCSASGNVSTGDITDNSYAGGLAGSNSGAVANCSANGSVSATGDYVGGLIGENITGGSVSNSSAMGAVSGSNYVGGLVGKNDEGSSIDSSYATGNLLGTSNCAGGFVGLNNGSVSTSYATGNVTGSSYAGGFAGYNDYGVINTSYATGNVSGGWDVGGFVGLNNYGTVNNSYSTGNASGTNERVGGLVGTNYANVSNSYARGNASGTQYIGGLVGLNTGGSAVISKSYSTGNVSGTSDLGGLVGSDGVGTGMTYNSFWDVNTSGRATSAGGTGLNTSLMKDFSTFFNAGWDLICEITNGTDDIWGIDYSGAGNNGYPFLWWQGLTHNVSFMLNMSSTDGGNVSTPGEGPFGPYNCSQVVPIEAAPDSGYFFLYWTSNTSNIADINNPNTSVTMNGNYSIQANFTNVMYNLSTASTAGGNVTVPGEGTYPYGGGHLVTINASPDPCYYFVSWTGDTGNISDINNPNTSITMNGNYSIQANFAIIQYMLNTSSTAGGNVTTPGEPGPYPYNCNEIATITATPAPCYHFVNWTGDTGTINDSSAASTTINMSNNYSVLANFAINTSTLTYTAGAGGTVNNTTPQVVNCSENGSPVLAVPNACYHFVNWNDSSTQNPRIDTATSVNQTFMANFAINTSTLTYTAGAGGTVNNTTPQVVNCSENGSPVLAVPNACYHFVNWNDSSTQNPRIDTATSVNQTFMANFAINTSTLTYTAGANGSINGTSPQTVNCGASGTAVRAVPNAGYRFFNWSDGRTVNPRTDTNVQGDVTVTANFRLGGGGGGGGGSTASQVLTMNVFNETSTHPIDNSGVLQQDVDAISQDGRVSIHIPAGTAALAQDGNPLTQIDFHLLDEYPEPPDGKIVIAAFNFEPDGATFNPAIQITITYDPATLPEGADESQLVIAFYNEASGQYEYVSGTVNPDTNTITFSITHFTVFAVMSQGESNAAPTTTPTLTPTPTPEVTVEPTVTPTIEPTATPTATPAAGDKGDNRPDDWVLIVLLVAGGALLAGLVGAIIIRKK